MATVLKDSSTLQAAIQKHEGFRSTPYWDVNGYAIGYGQHTNPQTGLPVQPGDYIDKSAADSLLASAIQPYANRVESQLGPDIWNKMNANQQNAMVDLAYNYGSVPKDVQAAVKEWDSTGDASKVTDALVSRGQRDNNGILMDRRLDEANAFANNQPLTGGKFTGGQGGPAGANGPAAGAGGAGGGAGCAGGLMGAIAGIAMAGILGGVGLGGAFSGISGALGQVGGAVSGALGSVGGAISGALGSVGSAISGAMGSISGALSGAMSGLTGALSSLPGVGQLGNIASSIGSSLGLSGITSSISGLTNGILGQISNIGAGILPGLGNVIPGVLSGGISQLLSPLTSVIQNPLNIIGVANQFSAAGGLAGFVKQVGMNMAGDFVGGTVQNFISNMGIANGISGMARQLVGGTAEAMGQAFGGGTGGLGGLIKNIEGMATFGASALGNNLGAVAADMISTGNWDTRNLTRLMQPGNIAAQIVAKGLGESTGLIQGLLNKGVPLAGMDNPVFDADVKSVLAGITGAAAIGAVTQAFGVGRPLNNLSQLTDIAHMMPNSAKNLPVNNFKDLGLTLTSMGVTQTNEFSEIGNAFLKIETTRDLNTITQMPTPMHKPSGELLLKTFGYGSGTFGETTMADVIGTAAGYVHEDTFPVIIDNINYLKSRSEATQYFKGVDFLEGLVGGKYTSGGTDGIGGITYSYVVPTGESGYTNGFIGTFSDSGTETSGVITNLTTTGYEAAISALITYIETGMTSLKNSTNAQVRAAIDAIEKAHAASIAQIMREATLLKSHDINIFYPQKVTTMGAYAFAMSLDSFANMTGHGQMADFLERVAQNNIYGDSIKAAMRMSRNAKVMADLGVNVERFNLPSGQYYRDPLTMTQDFYNGNLPTIPLYQQDIYYPPNLTDQYIVNRDAALVNSGNTEVTNPAEKDELYFDLMWKDVPTDVNKSLGESAVRSALNRNLKLLGDQVEIIDLERNRFLLGKLTPQGITDFDASTFISILFSIVNKLLYGDIGVTKNNNPFYTDEIVYGVTELLGVLNAANADALLNTKLGGVVVVDFLTMVANKYKAQGSVFDTGMDRNVPGVFGGTGPALGKDFLN